MKKGLLLILALVLCLTPVFAAAEAVVDDMNELVAGKTIATLTTPFEVTPELAQEFIGLTGFTPAQYPTMSECLTALLSGRADFVFAPLDTVQYLAESNPNLAYAKIALNVRSMKMLVRTEDNELLGDINDAITQLSQDDHARLLLDSIGNDLDAADAKSDDAADNPLTIRVGITGDLPPMDYIDAQGNPRGFNVAYMQEIGDIIGANIEFVQVANDAKFAALLSGKIDLFFWHLSAIHTDEISMSDTYLALDAALVYVKDNG